MNFRVLASGTDIAFKEGMDLIRLMGLIMLLSLALEKGHAAGLSSAVDSTDAIGRAHALIQAKRHDEALSLLKGIQPSGADLSPYHAAYAKALEESGDLRSAVEHYRLAYVFSKSNDMREELLLGRCKAYQKMLYHSEAAVCLDAFLESYPASKHRETARLQLADARMRLGEYAEAKRHYDLAGRSAAALFGKANALQAMGMYKDAYELYLSLLKNDKGYINSSEETRLAMGENFRVMGKTADAKIYLNSVQDDLLRPKASLSLGLIAMAEGRLDEAVRLFGEASASSDKHTRRRGLISRAEALIKAGRHKEAEAGLIEIRNSGPFGGDYDQAMLLLATVDRMDGRFDEAVTILQELLFRRSPEPAVLEGLEAVLIAVMEKKPEMLSYIWNKAGQWILDPSRSDTLLRLARALKGSGRPFLEICRWLGRYGPQSAKAEAALLLADFYTRLGDHAQAQRHLDAAASKRNTDEYIRVSTRLYAGQGAWSKAALGVMSLREPNEEDILLLLDLARNEAATGRLLKFVERALKKIPGTVRMYTRFADLLFAVGRTDDARKYYEAASNANAVGGQDRKDIEWARYRLSSYFPSANKTARPAKGKSQEERLAEADARAREIEIKTRKVL